MQAVRSFLCEESFGHSWTDTMQLTSIPTVPLSEPVPSFLKIRAIKLWVMVHNFCANLWRRFSRNTPSMSLHERIWGVRPVSLSPWRVRAGQVRFLADVGWRAMLLLVVAFTAWSMSEVGGESVKDRETREWESWRTDESVLIADARGDYYGRFFRAESDAEIARWWRGLENRIHVPSTIEGSFT
jgi:hypothetical protein